MKRLPMMFAATLVCVAANAQYWRALGRGVIGPTEVQTLFGDSISNRLLAGGTFMWILNTNDTVLGIGQAAWNGVRWDSIATRIQPISGNNSTNQTHWFLRFGGRLYACGFFGFQDTDGTWNNNLARLDEPNQRWGNLGCIVPFMTSISTLVPKEPQNTLYATGYMGSLCGYPQSCVFRYDGSAFHVWEPFNQIPEGNENYVGTVFDFQGKTYMTCALRDPAGPGYVSFLRWNGTAWEHVPGWNTLSPIKEILIRNDTLYVAGTFSLADGGPGNLVAAFSNDQWNNLGGGLFYNPVPMSGVVWDLKWFHGELWACGQFDWAAGVAAHSIAKWDGHRWCVPPGDFRWIYNSQSMLLDMAVWRDSLYVCGGILTVDGDTMKQVVQWLGGDVMEACSQTVGIAETALSAKEEELHITPLPGDASWYVHFPHIGTWTVEVFDATGHRLRTLQNHGAAIELDLSREAPGMYLLRVGSPTGESRSAKILRP